MATFHLSEIRSIPDVGNDLSSSDDESFVVLERGTNSTDFASVHNDAINKEIVEACAKAAEEELFRLSINNKKQVTPEVSASPIQVTVEKPQTQSIPDGKESISENTHNIDTPKGDSEVLEKFEESNISLPVYPKFENNLENLESNKPDLFSLASIDTMSSTAFSPEEIQAKVDSLIEENAELKERIARDNIMFDKILKYKKDTEATFEVNQKQFAEATTLINKLKEENKKLQEQVDALTAKNEQQINEIDFWKKRFELNEKTLSHLASWKTDAESKVNELTQKNEQLQAEIDKLGAGSSSADANNDQIIYLENLVTSTIQSSNMLKLQLANSQKKLTDCECSRNELLQKLKAKDEEIVMIQLANDAKKHFENPSSRPKFTDDDFYALQTQLEVYRTDFEAERSAKETFRTEKNQLAEDLQHIQVRNRELQEEIELMRAGGNFVHVQGPRRRESAESATPESTTRKYSCPKCSFAFTTFDALNNHVHRCLDLNESLP